jgi:hypothetical protein
MTTVCQASLATRIATCYAALCDTFLSSIEPVMKIERLHLRLSQLPVRRSLVPFVVL